MPPSLWHLKAKGPNEKQVFRMGRTEATLGAMETAAGLRRKMHCTKRLIPLPLEPKKNRSHRSTRVSLRAGAFCFQSNQESAVFSLLGDEKTTECWEIEIKRPFFASFLLAWTKRVASGGTRPAGFVLKSHKYKRGETPYE